MYGFLNSGSKLRTLQIHFREKSIMCCKVLDSHGGDYEECRLLGYKNPVRTSQKTHFSATETSPLMLRKIEVFKAVTMNYEEEEREVGSSERHYGWGNRIYHRF
jgi:hypothetical protein